MWMPRRDGTRWSWCWRSTSPPLLGSPSSCRWRMYPASSFRECSRFHGPCNGSINPIWTSESPPMSGVHIPAREYGHRIIVPKNWKKMRKIPVFCALKMEGFSHMTAHPGASVWGWQVYCLRFPQKCLFLQNPMCRIMTLFNAAKKKNEY